MYSEFAFLYDSLTGNVDYKARTDYLCSLFCRFDRMPTLLLDLACGTGGFSNQFAARGVSVIGVDISPEMLSVARENSADSGLDVLYLCQEASELDLYGTVDGAVCCLDSLNHITDYEWLCQTLKRVSLFLEKDRLFIFDVNTPFKHEKVLGNNSFVIENDDVFCAWQNEYVPQNKTVNISLDFFTRDGGAYHRASEEFSERAYTDDEIKDALSVAGLRCEAVYEEMTQNEPSDTAQRIIYVTRKVN